MLPTEAMETLPQHIADLIVQGRKVEAIKLICEETGVSIAEAKAAVDRLSSGAVAGGEVVHRVSPEAAALAYDGQIVEAIRLVRDETGVGLKEARALIAQLLGHPGRSLDRLPILALVVALFVLVLGAAIAVFLAAG